jgi:hypothetical protein
MLPLVVCFVDKRSFCIWFGQFTSGTRMRGHASSAEGLPSLNRVALTDVFFVSFASRFSISKRNVSFPFIFSMSDHAC